MLNLRHQSLVAWQRADDLFIKLHKLTIQSFPALERFELSAQLRTGAYSVAANIVEGYGRRHKGDRLYFLNIAEASLAEVSYCVHAAWRLGYVADQQLKDLEADLNGVGAPLSGLIRSGRISKAIMNSDRGIGMSHRRLFYRLTARPSCPSCPTRRTCLTRPNPSELQ